MGKGPKWSEEGVRALLSVVKSKLEMIGEMDDVRLDKECAKRMELEAYVGKNKEMKYAVLCEWTWQHALDGGLSPALAPAVESGLKTAKPGVTDAETELGKVLDLLKNHGSATDGGIRNTLFRGNEKVFELVMDYGYKTGKIKKDKTTSGTEIITAV